MVSTRLVLAIVAVLFVLAISVDAAYRKPPFNGSIFGKRSSTITALVAYVLALIVCENVSMADEVPAFFLKIAKNIPRVGRSDGYDDIFKSRRNIAKIGGHDGEGQHESWQSYSIDEPFSRPIKRRVNFPSPDDAWSWQNFPLAIEGPPELWRTLAGYSKDSSDEYVCRDN
ncbi:hypothetical protein WN48_01209 [Eufriesea mexicana]|nr:hypothetical protein WN48_01209 [Eufriesea mexicana]